MLRPYQVHRHTERGLASGNKRCETEWGRRAVRASARAGAARYGRRFGHAAQDRGGRVAWSSRAGVGVAFECLRRSAQEEISGSEGFGGAGSCGADDGDLVLVEVVTAGLQVSGSLGSK